jgi:uridine kinase
MTGAPVSPAPFVIGVAGGSGSGKTTVTRRVMRAVAEAGAAGRAAGQGEGGVALLVQDNYYRDQSHMPFQDRLSTNYDHPAAFDWDLLYGHLEALLAGQAIEAPIYDFTVHTRAAQTTTVQPSRVIVLEGFFALYEERVRQRLDLKVFVDADSDVRFIRRLLRDTSERGRSQESVIRQYLDDVRPMHLTFVEPTKRYADVIIQHGGMNEPALEMLAARIRATLHD